MEIVHVQPQESGTEGKRGRSATAGLTSGYQRTSNSSSGISAVETTGGFVLIEISTLPWYSALPIDENNINLNSDLKSQDRDELATGYKAMAGESSLFAEESLPLALEVWPSWEE